MTKTLLATLALTLAGATMVAAQNAAPVDPEIFPAAQAGQTRHVFTIPAIENEGNYQIEIVAGQTMSVDCNTVMISADLDDETLEGWGYTYYEIDDISQPASTMMGCPDNSRTDKFVGYHMGQDAFLRYNSNMPVIVYAPSDITVGYRIWQTDGVLQGQ